jgi:hypothetical protein
VNPTEIWPAPGDFVAFRRRNRAGFVVDIGREIGSALPSCQAEGLFRKENRCTILASVTTPAAALVRRPGVLKTLCQNAGAPGGSRVFPAA